MALGQLPRPFLVDVNGNPRVGAKLYVYQSGTTTLITTYTTAAYAVAHSSPILSTGAGLFPAFYVNEATYSTYKVVVKDSSDAEIYSEDNIPATGVSLDNVGRALYPRTDAEISAGITPSSYGHPAYVRGRYASWTDWAAACDEAGAEGQLDQDYEITADVELPKRCNFNGFQITGAYYTTHEFHGLASANPAGYVLGWRAKRPRIRGTYCCLYTGIDTGLDDTGYVEVWGGDGTTNPGCFWNDIGIAYTTKLTLDSDNFDINQNVFRGGIARRVHLTGSGSSLIEANKFINLDFSNNSLAEYGYYQDDTAMRCNSLIGPYGENGARIQGNVHIGVSGHMWDGTAVPLFGRYGHSMGSHSNAPRMRGDYLSLAALNLAVGGCWDILDSNGKPPCIDHSGGASVSVQTDTTTPGGIGRRYEATFQQDQDQFGVSFNTGGSDYFSAVIDYKSTLDFQAVVVDVNGTLASYDVTPTTIEMPSGWKRLRLSGQAYTSGNTIIRLIAANGGAISATAFSLGGVWVGTERAVPSPVRGQSIRGVTTVADGGTITHGLGRTPVHVTLTGSVSGEMLAATAVSSTTLTLAIKKHDNTAGTSQTVYWEVA